MHLGMNLKDGDSTTIRDEDTRKNQLYVHGHIHNYNQLTYIHGHVHNKIKQQQQQQQEEVISSDTTANDILFNDNNIPNIISNSNSSSSSSNPYNNSFPIVTDNNGCLEYDDCKHFEYINYHNLSMFQKYNQDNTNTVSNDIHNAQSNNNNNSNSNSNKIVEICCDNPHENLTTNATTTSATKNNDTKSNNECSNTSINKDLHCCKTDVSTLQKIEKCCEDNYKNISDILFVDPLTSSNTVIDESIKKLDTQLDTNILKDFMNISNMYDFPFNKNDSENIITNDTNTNTMGNTNNPFHNMMISNTSTFLPITSTISDSLHAHDHDHNNSHNNNHHHHHYHHHHKVEIPPIPIDGSTLKNEPFIEQSFPTNTHNQNHFPHHPDQDVTIPADKFLPQTLLNMHNEPETDHIDFNWINTYVEPKADIFCKWDNCSEKFTSLLDLQTHILKEHVGKQSRATVENTPTLPNVIIPQQEDVHTNCFWLDCLYESNNVYDLVNHINTEHGIGFQMERGISNEHTMHCNHSTSTHMVKSEGEVDTQSEATPEENSHKCTAECHICKWENCNLAFNSCKELDDHLLVDHLPKGQSSYYCQWDGCDKFFKQRQKLQRHLKVHSCYKGFSCELCSKSFATNESLLQHMKRHNQTYFECEKCNKKFTTQNSLKFHLKRHNGVKNWKCNKCDKLFNEISNFNKHTKTHNHHYKCDKCPKSYKRETSLNNHFLKSHK